LCRPVVGGILSLVEPLVTQTSVAKSREARWEEEARFFDSLAQSVDESKLPIDRLAYERYTRPVLRRRFNKEFRFRTMGDLRGKAILDVGCGDGLNSVMFAKMGAIVTAIDISPEAIAVAKRRAEVNGVSASAQFICAPIETADLPDDHFDLVVGNAILHHIPDELDHVLGQLARYGKQGALLLFSEPINLSMTLRRLRFIVPYATAATPGERPLVRSEIDQVRRYVPDLRLRHYSLLGRLDPLVLGGFSYERASSARRAIVNALDLLDYALLSLPYLNRLSGACVMYGHPSKPAVEGNVAGDTRFACW
jgi:2-polyprenyl-3-methyl-5-hydroxy-6-metoxy-1,4-benzoquinol methylase